MSESTEGSLATRYREICDKKGIRINRELFLMLEGVPAEGEISISYVGKSARLFSHRLTDGDSIALAKLFVPVASRIAHLDFSNNNLGLPAMETLAELFPRCENLVSLNLQYNEIGPEGCKKLLTALVALRQKHPSSKLEYLNLEGCRVKTEGLLRVSREEILFEGARSLVSELLENNSSLREFNLGENELEEVGLIELCSQLHPAMNFCSLAVLNLEGLDVKIFSEESAFELSKVVKNNSSLEKLSLSKCRLPDESLIILLKELANTKDSRSCLKVLDLSANKFTYLSCDILGQYLKRPECSLESLFLNHNKLGENGAKLLADALEINRSIVFLNLNYCDINERGLLHIRSMLEANSVIISLQLFWNHFGPTAIKEFYNLLKKNLKISLDFAVESDYLDFKIFELNEEISPLVYVKKPHFLPC